MKNVYLNIDLDVVAMNEILSYFLNIKAQSFNYLKLKRLDQEEINKLMSLLSPNDSLYFYNFKSLDLTLLEFKTLQDRLAQKNIQVFFLAEDPNYYKWLVELATIEFKVQSARVAETLAKKSKAKKECIVLGRPKVDANTQEEIIRLYNVDKRTMREIAEVCQVSLGTVYKYAHASKQQGH